MRTAAAALHASFLAGNSGMNEEPLMLTMSFFTSQHAKTKIKRQLLNQARMRANVQKINPCQQMAK